MGLYFREFCEGIGIAKFYLGIVDNQLCKEVTLSSLVTVFCENAHTNLHPRPQCTVIASHENEVLYTVELLYNGHFGTCRTVCYTEVSTVERLFNMHSNVRMCCTVSCICT